MEEVNLKFNGVDVQADLYLPADMAPGERRPARLLSATASVPSGKFWPRKAFISRTADGGFSGHHLSSNPRGRGA